MSGLVATVGLWSDDKSIALTKYTSHEHVPNPIAQHFEAPDPVQSLTLGPLALAGAVARTATVRDDAPPVVLDALKRSSLPMLEAMLEDGLAFALSPNFQHLADAERTFFAARVGSGITDLYMNAMGYTWRANAACLSSVLDPHADFLYEGGNASGHGVVLAEAHGSFAKNASAASVHLKAKNKYLEQVKPHLGKNSDYGKVIHGYCIAFGSAPGTSGAFLSLSETNIKKPKGKKGGPPAPTPPDISRERDTPTSIALAAHRSNFFLMGSDQLVSWIDWVRSRDRPMPAITPLVFLRLQYARRRYLIPVSSLWWLDPLRDWWPEFFDNERQWRHMLRWSLRPRSGRWPHLGCFAIEEGAGMAFLDALTGLIQNGPDSMPDMVRLPDLEPAGFGFGDETLARDRDEGSYQYALFRDGLALLGNPQRGRPRGVLTWAPKEGTAIEEWPESLTNAG